ncbi:papain family cysteine protease domain-containing protein [Ditylenchus destructor]|uniref:Papain family cysteine protease domain-containing protein n=1 Tax=Ditylenchus destructor TaxID=166010 RepID=A0AAD4MFN4_9BILA|nr:papain family cysteine protease domain-containing protein [Ditylenchus destructor]
MRVILRPLVKQSVKNHTTKILTTRTSTMINILVYREFAQYWFPEALKHRKPPKIIEGKGTFPGQPPFVIANDTAAIQKELYINGPLEVCFDVYEDFEHYTSGIYKHVARKYKYGHCVRLIGWGEENGTLFWILANTFNSDWGDHGFFRIVRGSNECNIEEAAVGALPDLKRCGMGGGTCRFYTVIDALPMDIAYVKHMFIVFRGTEMHAGQITSEIATTIWDFFNDAVTDDGPLQLNDFFKESFDLMWPTIEAILVRPEYRDYRIFFTGHSLGGAFASLAAFTTATEKIREAKDIYVYTFGQPRVGGLKYAEQFDEMGFAASYRVVNSEDLVPHLPPCSKGLDLVFLDEYWRANGYRRESTCGSKKYKRQYYGSYYHHGQEIWYKNGMDAEPFVSSSEGCFLPLPDSCNRIEVCANGVFLVSHNC